MVVVDVEDLAGVVFLVMRMTEPTMTTATITTMTAFRMRVRRRAALASACRLASRAARCLARFSLGMGRNPTWPSRGRWARAPV